MKRKWKQWTAILCLLMLLAASLHLARAESAPAQEECAPYRIVLTAPGGWNRSNSAVITVNVKDEQNLGWYQMAYRMNDGDWTDCEQLFDKSKAEIAVHENGTFTFRITDPHGHTFEESIRVAVIDRSAPTVKASITGTTLQVEVQDDLSGVAGVQVNSMLFTEQAGSIIRIALDDTLARYDTLSIRAFDYAGNFSEPVLLNQFAETDETPQFYGGNHRPADGNEASERAGRLTDLRQRRNFDDSSADTSAVPDTSHPVRSYRAGNALQGGRQCPYAGCAVQRCDQQAVHYPAKQEWQHLLPRYRLRQAH